MNQPCGEGSSLSQEEEEEEEPCGRIAVSHYLPTYLPAQVPHSLSCGNRARPLLLLLPAGRTVRGGCHSFIRYEWLLQKLLRAEEASKQGIHSFLHEWMDGWMDRPYHESIQQGYIQGGYIT